MKILFSPAESKKSGGEEGVIDAQSFIFPELYSYRREVLSRYSEYIKSADEEQLSRIFGIKDSKKFEKYRVDLFKSPLSKVITRYDGVAFEYLGYDLLKKSEKEYIDKSTIIFSNLFGPVLAGDFGVPEYKLKQGERIGDFAPELFYKRYFSDALDEYLGGEEYLDLRAGFYHKLYKPSSKYVTLKFLKNGKVVSHWAKAYRGLVLKSVAQNSIHSIEELMELEIKNLSIREILVKGIHKEIVFDIGF